MVDEKKTIKEREKELDKQVQKALKESTAFVLIGIDKKKITQLGRLYGSTDDLMKLASALREASDYAIQVVMKGIAKQGGKKDIIESKHGEEYKNIGVA